MDDKPVGNLKEELSTPNKKMEIKSLGLLKKYSSNKHIVSFVIIAGILVSIGVIYVARYHNVRNALGETRKCPSGLEYGGAVIDGKPVCTHEDKFTKSQLSMRVPESVAAAAASNIYCQGSGTDGDRFQAVYAYPSDRPDRSASIKSQYILPTVGAIDAELRNSASHTGGTRQLKWVTSSGCDLNVQVIRLSITAAEWRSLDQNQGGLVFNRILAGTGFGAQPPSNRRYAIWVDASDPGMDGSGYNWGGFYAIQSGESSWTSPFGMEHEVMHGLGAVAAGAPHSTGAGHCYDAVDIMCYNDGGSNWRELNVCSIAYYDCNHDDYFYAGTPPSGSFLANNPTANAANSRFLASTTVTPPQPPNPVPANNNFASATNIANPVAAQVNGSNVNATAEAGEPAHAGSLARRSIWYKFTPSTTGTYVIKTWTDGGAYSSFDTVLGVYKRGPTTLFNGLVSVASNDDSNGKVQSKVTITGTAAKTYWIAIDGKNGATGTTVLQIRKQ